MSDPVALSEAEIDDLTDGCDGQGEYMCCHRDIHRRTKEPVGGRMLDAVERILASRLAAADRDTALREAVEALADEAQHDVDQANATPDPLTGRHSTMRAFVLVDDLRAALAQPPTSGDA